MMKKNSHARLNWRDVPWNLPSRALLLGCSVFLLCLCTSIFGSLLEIYVPRPAWLLWPGCAILVAVLALVRQKQWPLVIATGLAGFGVYDWRAGLAVSSIAPLILVDAMEVLTAAVALRVTFDGEPQLDTVKGLAKYFLIALIIVPITTATIGPAVLGGGHFWISWRVTFFSEALAFLLLPPAILSWAKRLRDWQTESAGYWIEVCGLILAVSLLAYTISVASRELVPALFYALVPLLIWSALRFGLLGVSTAIVIVAFLSIWGSIHGRGPFTGLTPIEQTLSLQLFLFCAAIPFMVLAVLATEHKRSSEALRESENRFRLIADRAPVMIWMCDIDKKFIFLNKTCLNFAGRSIEEVLERRWTVGIHPDDLEQYLTAQSMAFGARQEFSIEYRLRRFDGDYRWIADNGVPRFESNGAFCGYIGACIDTTDRKLYESSLQDFNGRLIMAQEQERSKIARELHDELSQRMARLLIRLERCLHGTEGTSTTIRERLTNAVEMASEISAALRDLSHVLHPGTLAALGLEGSVAACCREFSEQHNLRVTFVHCDIPKDSPADVNLCLFRIVQEALQNVAKHSGAQEARVSLSGNGEQIHLQVDDSGIGFDPRSSRMTGTLGLVSMRERVRLVGGHISIQSTPASGTRIDVHVPYAPQPSAIH
jgi:PAS domain S-box-containing protein